MEFYEFKCRAEDYLHVREFKNKLRYLNNTEFIRGTEKVPLVSILDFELILEDSTEEEGEAEFYLKTEFHMSDIQRIIKSIDNSDLMLDTFNSAEVYTGERWFKSTQS